VCKLPCIASEGVCLVGSVGECMLYEEKNLEEWVGGIEKDFGGSSGVYQRERPLFFLLSGLLSNCWALRLRGRAAKRDC
jgi:hypothetical protein